jgi:hypothetical protein
VKEGYVHRSHANPARRIAAAAAAAAVAGLAIPGAADFRQTTLDELVAACEDALVVRVDRIEVRYGALQDVDGEVPFRVACGAVLDQWRGRRPAPSRVEIWIPGGPTQDGGEYMVSTSPSVAGLAGRTVLVFVERDHYGGGRMGLPFCDHGLYRVATPRRSAEPIVLGKPGAPIGADVVLASLRDRVRAKATIGEEAHR